MSKLTDCITAHGVKTHARLPEDVKAAVAAGDTALAVSTMQAHVAALKTLRQEIETQHEENKKDFMAQTVSKTSAVSYVSRGEKDPTNELNHFRVKSFSKIWKNLVQRAGSFAAAVGLLKAKPDQVITEGERAVLEHFMSGPESFGRQMSETIKTIFKAKEGSSFKYRYEDMIQYLPVRYPAEFGENSNPKIDAEHAREHGILDRPTRAAIAATAYEWIATSGRKSMTQTESSLGRLLGLQKDEPIPGNAQELLENAGMNAETVARQLGKTILQRLSIAPGPQSDSLARSRMEESLGFMALAAMESLGVIERQYVIADHTEEAKAAFIAAGKPVPAIGLNALKEGRDLEPGELFYTANDSKPDGPKGFLMMRLVRVVNTDVLKDIENHFKEGRAAFDKVFANEPQEFDVQWKAKERKAFKIGNSNIEANAEQTRNINKYNAIPYRRNPEAIGFLKSMWDLVEGQGTKEEQDQLRAVFYELLGAPPAENLLKLHKKGNDGIRRGIEQDFLDVLSYEEEHAKREANGESTEFYLSSDFMSNMRMIMRGDINPQNSKMHRSLFAPTGFTTTFKKDPKGKLDQAFLEAVAVAFDIETGKGLIGDAKAQVAKLMDIMTNPDNDKHAAVTAAIEAIQAPGEMTAERMQIIAAGSAAVDNKVTGLKGLFEYARYTATPIGAEFTTDMHAEIDGVSNGVIIGILQLMPDSVDKRAVLATLAMGGISTSTARADLNKLLIKHNLNDAYQRMAQEWAKEILALKKNWHTSTKSADSALYEKAQALGRILGEFQDPQGVINKTIRSLSKPRTMQIIYGAGIRKQIQLLTGENVLHDGIYKKVEKIIGRARKADQANPDLKIREDFAALMRDVRTLTGDSSYRMERYFTGVSKEETIANLQAFKLRPEHIKTLNQAVADTYGKAMSNAIDTVYGPLIEARKPLTAAVQLAVTTYNTILKKKVDLLVQAHKADAGFEGDPEVITNEELAEILSSIEHLVPKIKTPLHTKDSPSYLPMAEVGNNRSYTKQARVVQQYLQKGLVQHQGYAEGIPYLGDPGMSPVVKGIQMLDSMVANGLMGLDTHMLNNHDGFSHGIGDSEVIAQAANQIFAKTMTDYSLAQAFEEMHLELAEKGKAMMTELGVTPKEFLRGTSRNPDAPSAYTGGLINDRVVSFDLLVSMKLATKEERDGYAKEAEELEGMSYRAAVRQYINDVIARQGGSDADFTERALAQLTEDLKEIAEQTARNKKEITDAVRQWHQYPHHGVGFVVENPVNSSGKFFGKIHTNTVLTHDAKARDKDIETIQGFQAEGYNSSSAGNVSTNEADYTQPSQVIDSQNVVESFDALVDMDSKLAYASVQNSPAHVDYLRGVLNSIVSRVMGPVEMFMDQHKINNETQGMYTIGANGTQRIWIQTQQRSDHPLAGMLGQSIRMSAAEVYAHELVHHITHTGLKNFPHLQRQASALRELAFQEFTKAYGEHAYRVFLNDPASDVTDPANAYEVAAAKDRWEYVFNPKRKKDGSNAGLDEFISFGMTNENFKRELGKLQVSAEIINARKPLYTIFEKNIQQTLVNLFTTILDFIYQTFHQQRHSAQVDQELENLVRALSYVDSKNKSVLWKFAADTEAAITAVSLKIDEKVVDTVKAAIDKTKIGGAINQLKQFPQLNNMLSHQMRIALHWYTSQQQGLIPSIITEMNGTTDRMRPFHDRLRMRNHVLDAAKNEATLVVRDKVNSWFKQALTPAQKTAITKALLKTDVGSLLDKGLTPQAITGYLADDAQREARIAEILNQIKSDSVLKDYAVYFENAADDLGYFMVHSARKTKESMPLMNAHNIVAMKNSKHAGKLAGENYGRALDLVDQLATLSSLRYVQKAQKRAVAELMASEWTAVENVLNQHNKLKDDAFRDLFHGNPVKMTKGYVEQILNSRVKFEQAHVANPDDPNDPTRKLFEDAGYYMQATPIPRDPADPVQDNIYMFRSMLGAVNDLQPGIMSYSQNIGRGTTAYDLQQQIGNNVDPAQAAERNNRIVLADTLNTIDNMFKVRTPAKQALGSGKNYMIPKFDDKGNIAEMRYMMSEATKDIVLEQFSEVDAVLGRMAATLIDKVVTPQINADVIDALKDVADHKDYGRKALPEAFVEISPWSPEKRYRDIYHQLPPNARKQILSIWGENRMWVSQDMVDLVFGQRKYSVSETFSKSKKESNLFEKMFVEVMKLALGGHNPLSEPPPGAKANDSVQGRAVRRTTTVYNTLAQLTKLGKANIVVRNLGVVFGNHNSNMMLLKSMGIPLEKIILYNKEAMTGILQYQKDKHELESWRLELGVVQRKQSLTQAEKDIQVRNINRRIAVLENQLALNKATPLVREGAMPSVVDDFDTDYAPPPFTYGVDALLDKGIEMLPKGLQRAGRTLFMTTDTEGFRMMNNAVKLTDFTGRYILYKHLTAKGMSHDLAVSTVMDKFINFDLPTHRMISMVNDIGLVMFSKYQLRVLKHIKDVLKEHPFTALATYIIGRHIGDNNIINSIPFVTKDVMQNIGNAVSLTGTVWNTAVIDGVQYVGGLAADVVTPGT